VAFDGWGALRAGKPFHVQDHPARWRQVEAWRRSRLGPCRDLIRFYESMAIFAWFSGCDAEPSGSADRGALGAAAGRDAGPDGHSPRPTG
jgi:hypothetical protein